jgi:hypothetical protein
MNADQKAMAALTAYLASLEYAKWWAENYPGGGQCVPETLRCHFGNFLDFLRRLS